MNVIGSEHVLGKCSGIQISVFFVKRNRYLGQILMLFMYGMNFLNTSVED